MRILVTDGMDQAAMETLRGQGHEIVGTVLRARSAGRRPAGI